MACFMRSSVFAKRKEDIPLLGASISSLNATVVEGKSNRNFTSIQFFTEGASEIHERKKRKKEEGTNLQNFEQCQYTTEYYY